MRKQRETLFIAISAILVWVSGYSAGQYIIPVPVPNNLTYIEVLSGKQEITREEAIAVIVYARNSHIPFAKEGSQPIIGTPEQHRQIMARYNLVIKYIEEHGE